MSMPAKFSKPYGHTKKSRATIIGYALLLALTIITWVSLSQMKPTRITSVMVPHHDIVAKQRSEMFSLLSKKTNPQTIILASTNHYNQGGAEIQTTSRTLSTKYGEISIDPQMFNLAVSLGAIDTPATFSAEHGISTILPDVKRYFPNAKLLPLIIKDTTDTNQLAAFFDNVYNQHPDCLFIASVDFSHYQPYILSELHDDLSIRALYNADSDAALTKAEVGEPHILWSAIEWAKRADTTHFVTHNHTNATEIANDYYAEGTTHVFGWYESGAMAIHPPEISFTLTGDMLLPLNKTDQTPELLGKLGDRVLWGTDLVLANLEGPVTSQPARDTSSDMPIFRYDQAVLPLLSNLRLTHLMIDNNHSQDAGQKGFKDTINNLNAKKITPVYSDITPTIIAGHKIDIVLYALDAAAGDQIDTRTIQKFSQDPTKRIIIYVHWGPEYNSVQTGPQQSLAHQWIDAGADLVVGSGPHVIQPAEVYQGVPIFYSLGNFIADYPAGTPMSQGLTLVGKFTQENTQISPLVTVLDRQQPALERSADTDTAIKSRYFKSFNAFVTEDRGGILWSFPAKP